MCDGRKLLGNQQRTSAILFSSWSVLVCSTNEKLGPDANCHDELSDPCGNPQVSNEERHYLIPTSREYKAIVAVTISTQLWQYAYLLEDVTPRSTLIGESSQVILSFVLYELRHQTGYIEDLAALAQSVVTLRCEVVVSRSTYR